MPQHLAIIMDGNGRWAKKRLLPRLMGHQAGARAVRDIVAAAVQRRIPTLSLFAFSAENWQRPAAEVQGLMQMIERHIQQEQEALHRQNIAVRFLGERRNLSPGLQQAMTALENLTAANDGLQLLLAINYSGQWAIMETLRRALQAGIRAEDWNSERYEALRPYPIPPVDLLIRSSGEQRLSNFHLWEMAYAEFYFSPKLWPDFTAVDLDEALQAYRQRQRRYGNINEESPC